MGEFIIWVIVLIVYALLQGRAAKRKKEAQRKAPQPVLPGQEGGAARKPSLDLGGMLREIEEALTQGQSDAPHETQAPPPEPARRTMQPAPTVTSAPSPREFRGWETSYEGHSFESAGDDAFLFNQQDKYATEWSAPDDRNSQTSPTPATRPVSNDSFRKWRKDILNDPQKAREALLYYEVFGPPVSQRRR